MSKTLLISRVFPPQIGGNGHWMWELYSRLPRGEFLVAAGQSSGAAAFDQTHELPIVRIPMQLSSWGILGVRRGVAYYAIYTQLCRLVREQQIESVHASNCLPEGFLAWMLCRQFGLPYFVYAHGEELNIAKHSRELSWMAGRVFRGATKAIANSRNTASLLFQRWPRIQNNVYVMHPGVDTQKFRPAPYNLEVRRKLLWHDRLVILTVGRLMKRKGHERIIRALPDIIKSVPNVLYAVVGDGEERLKLEQLTMDLGLSNHVIFHGEQDQRELVNAYQQCDVFAMTNYDVGGDIEGFGMVFLEAQACGKPVIAGDTGGTRDAINSPHSGRIVGTCRPDDLVQTLLTFLHDRDLRDRMGRAGREWVESRFDWRLLANEALQLFSATSRRGENVRISAPLLAEPLANKQTFELIQDG